eukprot:gnl/Spiro4/1102_TR579_c0_g1_i1.p1 gnl/Spiro4/1102_TR579_c0_g1~~gnl/Spiro4/1102_TR579_c0_g1_i1.p1  ORF type:complete len:238 (+),score=39.64 gnl/Spiro4/1102_TR579_c0_g1_i1:63-716(+)
MAQQTTSTATPNSQHSELELYANIVVALSREVPTGWEATRFSSLVDAEKGAEAAICDKVASFVKDRWVSTFGADRGNSAVLVRANFSLDPSSSSPTHAHHFAILPAARNDGLVVVYWGTWLRAARYQEPDVSKAKDSATALEMLEKYRRAFAKAVGDSARFLVFVPCELPSCPPLAQISQAIMARLTDELRLKELVKEGPLCDLRTRDFGLTHDVSL